jgi:hypothetical protein
MAKVLFVESDTDFPLRRAVVIIVSANRTEDRGFKSLHGVRYLGRYALQCCSLVT